MDSTLYQFPDKLQRTIVCSIPQKNAQAPKVDIGIKDEPAFDDYDKNVYLFHVDVSPHGKYTAVSTSNQQVKVYDIETSGVLLDITKHNGPISSLQFIDDNTICSTSTDGEILLWDLKSNSEITSIKFNNEIYCCAIKGDLVAAGSRSLLPMWDLRTQKSVTSYTFHNDDISQVKFHPTTGLLHSSDCDGLSLIFDTNQPDGDDAVVNIVNLGQCIQRFGFGGVNYEYIYFLLSSEEFQLCGLSNDSIVPVYKSGFDFRTKLSDLAKIEVNYLVDCHYIASMNQLILFGGSFDGNLSAFSLQENGFEHITNLTNGHNGVVRGFHFKDSLITVGEDSKMCIWEHSESKKDVLRSLRDGEKSFLRPKPY